MLNLGHSNNFVTKGFSGLYFFGAKTLKVHRQFLLLPFFSTLIIYSICYWTGKLLAGLNYQAIAIRRDFFLQLILAYLIFGFFRRKRLFVIAQVLTVGLLFSAHAAKVAFHGVPISPDDIFAISDLFWVVEKWQRGVMLLFGLTLPLVLVLGTHLKRVAVVMALLLVIGGSLTQKDASSAFTVLKNTYANSVWDSRGNLVNRGATLHTFMEGLRYISDYHKPPTAVEVNKALISLAGMQGLINSITPVANASVAMPNVHLILLESFWDARLLSGAKFSRNPFDKDFLELWKETGYSKCLPPVYGGYTANSEFEALAGFPVEENSVKFERRLRNDVPGLPKFLAKQGYATFASHPNVAGFWNRTNAYRRLGFKTYWAVEHFDLDDLNSEFLSDESLYRQILERLDPLLQSGEPVFNYIVTYTGHFPYPLNEKRPHIVKSESTQPLVIKYANTIYYKSAELMKFINILKERDPDGIIVAFGDHAPFLGPNQAGYKESNLLSSKMSDWTPQMLKTAYSTPLIVINGRKGPVNAGTLPLYRLPSLILSLIGLKEKGMLDYTHQPEDYVIRPLPGRQLVLDKKLTPFVYNSEEPPLLPKELLAWMGQMEILSEDLFIGQQYCINGLSKKNSSGMVSQKAVLPHQDREEKSVDPNG